MILAAVLIAAAGISAVLLIRGQTPPTLWVAPLPGQDPSEAAPKVVLGADDVPAQAALPMLDPLTIHIPVLEVSGHIGLATVDGDGVLDPPHVSTTVGLWPGSASLASDTGEVTIAGHVNWAGMSPFTFGKLAYLKRGNTIYTSDASGRVTRWRVASVSARGKSEPVDHGAFRGAVGPRRLALITCGGSFDAERRSYVDNVYVYADPVTTPRQAARKGVTAPKSATGARG
ncbi:class F sortase [Pedococcus dokdonensis]|uniref:class F sortase n=1 Tax=Pedococcus dokdonensis TaxID=443156 RepID=UPI0012FD37BA|nr:class F sortase [Pedococcus dokdonensis]